jgi:hypothetical protein
MALALLPFEHVEQAFSLLREESPESMNEFFAYMQHQWFKRVPPKYWNVSNLEFRTNNYAEGESVSFSKRVLTLRFQGWHNKFNHRVEKHHPNVWHLFECLKQEEVSFRQQLGKINSGQKKKPVDKSFTIEIQIETLTDRHRDKEIGLMELLQGLSTLVA